MKIPNGFTLIEAIIYLALLAVIFTSVSAVVYGMVESSGSSKANINLQEEGGFLLSKFNWALSGAESFSAISSPPSLSINKYADPSNPLVFTLSGGELMLKEGAPSPLPLNSGNTEVINLNFQDIPSVGGSTEGIIVSFILKSLSSSGRSISQPFEITKYLEQ